MQTSTNTFRPVVTGPMLTVGQESYWTPETQPSWLPEGTVVQYRRFNGAGSVEVYAEVVRTKDGLLLDWATHSSLLSPTAVTRNLQK